MSERFIGIGLGVVFLVLIANMGMVAYFGLRSIESEHAQARSMATHEWIDVQLAEEALAYSNRNTRINMQLVASTNRTEIDSLIGQRRDNSDKITAIIKRLRTHVTTQEEQRLLDAVEETRIAYVNSYHYATQLAVEGRNGEAGQWLLHDTPPLLLKYHDAWNKFVDFQTGDLNQRLNEAAAAHQTTRKKTFRFMALSMLLTATMGVFVIRKITVEVHSRQKADTALRKLNEGLEVNIAERTVALGKTNQSLNSEIAERKKIEENLRFKTALLEAQVHSTIDGILVVDREGRKLLQNQVFQEIFELPQTVIDNPDDSVSLDSAARRLVNPEQFRERVRYLYDHEDETTHDELEFLNGKAVERYSAPLRGNDGIHYGRLWVFRDITRRKRSEETVRLLSTAIEQSPVSVVITDLHACILYVNSKFVECTGYTREEVIGKTPRILKSGYTSGEEYQQLWKTITSGNEWRGEFHNRRKNGTLYWESALIRPIRDDKGNIFRFLAVKEDITERRAMEEELRRAQKLESIGQLAAGIAHEINTPMQFICDNTRFMQEAWNTWSPVTAALCQVREGRVSEDLQREILASLAAIDVNELVYLQSEIPRAIMQCLDGVERVSRIVLAMKRFSHPGSEEKQPIDINDAIQTTITVARNEWKYVAEVETALSPDMGLVPCFAGEFNQVILNLLVNAAQAIGGMAKDDRKGRIRIRSRRVDNWAEVSMEDTGCGISPEIQSRIFDPFFTTKEVGKGSGQGLAIAHSVVVKKHGGQIWFETEPGRGTTFFIRLPLEAKTKESRPAHRASGAGASS